MHINNTNQKNEPDIECDFIGNYTVNNDDVREKVDHGDNYGLCDGQANCGRMRDRLKNQQNKGKQKGNVV